MTRRILFAERGGWELALDNPDAVVVDLDLPHLRRGTARFPVPQPRIFAFLCHLLRSPDRLQERAAISQAVFGRLNEADRGVSQLITRAGPALAFLGMTVEVAYGRGLILHSDPTESLPCAILALGPQPPSHVRSLCPEPKIRPLLRLDSRSGSMPAVKARTRLQTRSSRTGTKSVPGSRGPVIS